MIERKWIMLSLCCLVWFANTYGGNVSSPLKVQIKSSLKIDDTEFNSYSSINALPNIFIPIFAGVAIPKFTPHRCLLAFYGFATLGQIIFAIGIAFKSYSLTLAGRCISGLGNASLNVAGSSLLAKWFDGKQVAFAMGAGITATGLSVVACDNLSSYLDTKYGLEFAVWFSLGVMVIALVISSVGIYFVESQENADSVGENEEKYEKPGLKNYFFIPKIATFSLCYWIILASCSLTLGAYPAFSANSNEFLQMKYKADKPTAACIMAIPNWISAIGTFIAGAAIDYFGRRTLILIFSSSLLALSHGLMTLTSITPYLTLSILGVGAMVYNAVIWPSISMVIPQKYAGLAYGTATCILNTIYTISPLVVGHILDSIHDYYYVELFYFILLIASVGTNFGLHFADRLKNNSILNRNKMRISNSSHLNSPLADDSDRSALTNSEEISKNA